MPLLPLPSQFPTFKALWSRKAEADWNQTPAGVPIRILAALEKFDKYRKPRTGMFDVVQKVYKERGYEIDLARSLFVGDAAGRMPIGHGRQARDHADTDYKFALNVGIPFKTPEEYFLHYHSTYPTIPVTFRPAKIQNLSNRECGKMMTDSDADKR